VAFGFIGKLSCEPGRRDDMVRQLLAAAELLAQDPECIHYIVSTSDEADAIWVWEMWTTRAAHASSLEREDVRALVEQARPLITGMSDRRELTIQGGKGLDT
jgi:quinol monooxygenase YgiN